MLRIDNITTDPLQERDVVLLDGTIVNMTMYYMPMQYGWFLRNLNYEDFEINNFRITNHANFLYQFKNQIPFGMACFTIGDREPTLQEDFASGQSKLYILTEEEVTQYENFLDGQV